VHYFYFLFYFIFLFYNGCWAILSIICDKKNSSDVLEEESAMTGGLHCMHTFVFPAKLSLNNFLPLC
jgi:hypothetical protein